MKFRLAILVVVALVASCITLTSGAITTFKAGPFNVSVDIGMPCNDINIKEPTRTETISGNSFTDYYVIICDVALELIRYDEDVFQRNTPFSPDAVRNMILTAGASEDTILVYPREINSKSIAVGSGYIPKYDETVYTAGFIISPKSLCYIYVFGNGTKMVSAMKSIRITEAA